MADLKVDILHIYKMATEQALSARDLDEKIKAYSDVINFCMNSRNCRLDDSVKRNKIILWSYEKIADFLVEKNNTNTFDKQNYTDAIRYYNGAFQVAREKDDKLSILEKIAEIYALMGNVSKSEEIKEQKIEYLDDTLKSKAYEELADEVGDEQKSIELLEKALNFVTKDEISVFVKCQNTLQIAEKLMIKFKLLKDMKNITRIHDLMDKTAILAINVLNERILNEDDRAKKINLYVKLIELEDRYMTSSNQQKIRAYKKLADLLDDDEVLKIEGVRLSRKNLNDLIAKLNHS